MISEPFFLVFSTFIRGTAQSLAMQAAELYPRTYPIKFYSIDRTKYKKWLNAFTECDILRLNMSEVKQNGSS